MASRAEYGARIAEARSLIRSGQFDAARGLVAALRDDPGTAVLGQITALGLPRRIVGTLLMLAKAEGDAVTRAGLQYHLVPPIEILGRHLHCPTTQRRALAEAARQEVPRKLHQIWIGPRPVPETVAAWAEHSARHGFAHRLWREADLTAAGIDRNPVFQAMLARGDYPGAVDAARYQILVAEGGIYLDCDWYPARMDQSFADRMPLVGLGAFAEDPPRMTGSGPMMLANSLIAAPQGHPALARLLAALPGLVADLPDAPAWWSTGPLPFTIAVRDGPVALFDAGIIAGTAPQGCSLADARDCCRGEGGLLLAWKPW